MGKSCGLVAKPQGIRGKKLGGFSAEFVRNSHGLFGILYGINWSYWESRSERSEPASAASERAERWTFSDDVETFRLDVK